MKITYRRLATASLNVAISDPLNRNIMSMSTLIASDQFLHEVPWDGMTIGDAQIYINENCSSNGTALTGADGKPMEPQWRWWGGVPRAQIKYYKFVDVSGIYPQTLEPELMRLDFDHAEPQAELPKSAKAGGARA